MSLVESAIYLGMDSRAFCRLVLAEVPVIDVEDQKVVDRRDLDAWADLFKARNGRVTARELAPRAQGALSAVQAIKSAVPPPPAPVQRAPELPRNAIIRLPEVLRRTGLSRSSIYQRVNAGTFPKPRSLGARAVGWPLSEVEDWLAAVVSSTNGTATANADCRR